MFLKNNERKMKYIFISIILALIFTSSICSQEFKREWKKGKLTWDDFSEKDYDYSSTELNYFFGYKSDKQRFHDTILIRNFATIYMDKNLSWVNPQQKTEQNLKYNQVVFDIIELYRRKLQHELDISKSESTTDYQFSFIFESLKTKLNDFRNESKNGNNLNSISKWENQIAIELMEYPTYNVPEFLESNFGYGLYLALGTGAFSGLLNKYFSQSFNLLYGFDFSYKKFMLFLNASLSAGKVSQSYLPNNQITSNKRTTNAIIDFSFGYVVLNKSKLKLTPFVGWGITEININDESDLHNDFRLSDGNIIFGLNADYKLWKKINLVPNLLFNIKEKVETSIRARLYVSKVYYYSDLNGYSINLGIGISGFGNIIKFD